jgi:hypothetical protein
VALLEQGEGTVDLGVVARLGEGGARRPHLVLAAQS